MGSASKWNDYKNLSIRISAGDKQELHGTGVLYKTRAGKQVLILTAAHVIKNIENKFGTNARCYFDCATGNGHDKQIKCVLEDGKSVFYHPKYCIETSEYDVAMVVVPWQDWMESLITIPIEPAEEEKQQGWGFPESMDIECKKESKRAGLKKLEGEMDSSIEEFRYKLSHELPNLSKKREQMMRGFSGTGLFEELSNTKIHLVGIVSKAAGDETSGGSLWAMNATAIREMIKHYNMDIEIPASMEEFRELAADEIGRERKEETGFFLDCANHLIRKENLTPEYVLKNDLGADINLKCKQVKIACKEYWKGQILWKAMVNGVLEKSGFEIVHPNFSLPCGNNINDSQDVEVVMICADEKQEKVICSLLEKNYFARNSEHGNLRDKMIFLLNGINAIMCDSTVTRRQCRHIMQDITNQYQAMDREALVNMASNMLEDPYEDRFDIVSGQIRQCNLAILGIGKIRQIWKEGRGNKEKMKAKWEGLVEEVWEE